MANPSLTALVEQIRAERDLGPEVPGVDLQNGNEQARFLFVLEAPGPKAVASGKISIDNADPTARNFSDQLRRAGISKSDFALWNVVPWYLGNDTRTRIRSAKVSDVLLGLGYLTRVLDALPRLQCIVLVGGAARLAHVHLSHRTRVRILSCHHPSPKVQNTKSGATEENLAVFRHMLATSNES